MDNNDKNIKITSAALISAALVAVFVAVITVYADIYAPLKDWLKVNFYHHWVGKGILSAILFLASFIGFLFKNPNEKFLNFSLKLAFWLAIISSAAILIFYLYEVSLAH